MNSSVEAIPALNLGLAFLPVAVVVGILQGIVALCALILLASRGSA